MMLELRAAYQRRQTGKMAEVCEMWWWRDGEMATIITAELQCSQPP